MAESFLEIKISDVSLASMPIDVAISFTSLVEALTKIANLTLGNDNLKVQIREGSAVACIYGTSLENTVAEYKEVVENRSTNKDLVEEWRNIQEIFKANGLAYEAYYNIGGVTTDILQPLKAAKRLRVRASEPKKYHTTLQFFSGELIENGGKRPNIHVDIEGVGEKTIACTKLSAQKANVYLYSKIHFSAWVSESDDDVEYQLCDSYSTPEAFENYRSFINDFYSMPLLDALKVLHYKCRDYLDAKEYKRLRRFLRLFDHQSVDVNFLKTILIITQGFKEQEDLSGIRNSIKEKFDNRMKAIRKTKSNV